MKTTQARAIALAIFSLLIVSVGYNIKQHVEINKYQETTKQIFGVVTNLRGGAAIKSVDELARLMQPVRSREVTCMAENIYREAATQSLAGKIAVGQVVINRTKSGQYPNNVCAVIYQKATVNNHKVCQFSWTCAKKPTPIDYKSVAWQQSTQVAHNLLFYTSNTLLDITNGSTHYHTHTVSPSWKHSLKRTASIDQHQFYKL